MRTIATGASWVLRGRSATAAALQTLLTRLLILGINMGTGIITARILDPHGRGEQAAITMWPQFLAYTMTLGLPAALVYNFKRYPEEKPKLLSAAVILSLGLGTLATLTGIALIPQWLAKGYSPAVIQFAQWYMLLAPVVLLSDTFIAALEAIEEFSIANQVRYLPPFLTLAILSALASTHTLTPFTSALAYAFPTLPIFFWTLTKILQHFQPQLQNLRSSYQRLVNYGVRGYGMDLLGTLAGQLDQVLVVNLLTSKSMGLYVVALSLSRMLNVLHNSIITVLFPKTAARPAAEVIELTGRAARISTTITLFTAIAVIAIGPFALQLLYGQEFVTAVPVFRLFVIDAVLNGTAWVLVQAFMALGRPGVITIIQAICLGLTVPLLLVFIPNFGLEGAGLAILCATIARLLLVLLSFPVILKIQPPSLLVSREDVIFIRQLIRGNRTNESQL